MTIVQLTKTAGKQWKTIAGSLNEIENALVLVFGERYLLEDANEIREIEQMFPVQDIIYGSTSGEILGNSVTENSIVITAIDFESSRFEIHRDNILAHEKNANEVGANLIRKLDEKDLKHVFVISEGSFVNGSDLIDGLQRNLDENIAITGGLCGDSDRFEKTIVGYNEAPKEGEIVIIGLYGESLEVTYANYCGWTAFGPQREVTKSDGNILHELDSIPALDLYKKYLGDKVKELPKSALLYPLSISIEGKDMPLVRTILNINEEEGTMTLAGDIPKGSKVQLMMANVDNITEGAYRAAEYAMKERKTAPELAILISCIGRKLVMDQRVEEEIDEVLDVIGTNTKAVGFYSYGELAPFSNERKCELHNQTMTLTLLSE